MCRRYRFFARFDMEFDESGGRFHARQKPGPWVVAVEGEEPSRWMKPSLGSDGEVFYCLGVTSDASRDICVRLDWSRVSVTENVRVENDTLFVVLIDSYISSAGEDFVRYLRQLENVVFVGTNTQGTMLAGNVGVCMLPNSKLTLTCGTNIPLGEDLSNCDGLGYMPDLWVHPEQALERAVKYIWASQAGGGEC